MNHEMRLHDEPFKLIKAGTKTIELRLYDEKRQEIKVGDEIEFTSRATGEKQVTKVVALHTYRPVYTCSEENTVSNVQCGSCCQFR